MGGKVWTEDEERIFWEVIIPESPNSADPDHESQGWKHCAKLMQEMMGDRARHEHHYQSLKLGAKSAKASKFFAKHLRDLEWYQKGNKGPRPSTPPRIPDKENEDLLASILANDPAAKAFVRNKPAGRGRSQAQPASASLGRGAQNQTAGCDERYELPPAATYRLGTSRGANRTQPPNVQQPAPTDPTSLDSNPLYGYGYHQVGYQESNIDPMLTSGVAIAKSGFPSDHVPGLSTSASPTSTVDTATSEAPVTKRYRSIAPAPSPSYNLNRAVAPPAPSYNMDRSVASPAPPYNMDRAVDLSARYYEENTGQRHRKRQLLGDDVERSPPKRATLSTNSGTHPTLDPRVLDPRLQPTSHWQRMGFRDDHAPWRTTEAPVAPAAANYPPRSLPPLSSVWQRPDTNTAATPGTIEIFCTDSQYSRTRYRDGPGNLGQDPETPGRLRYGHYSQTPGEDPGRKNTSERGRYERERYRKDGSDDKSS
ncbi:hypothetical protein G7Z17_g12342 [Cylindrodendrum hubeiense]|uniref:Uncharacterized protein n=1 Tax=Cylindrodendrum hubeiense TaxID=595255 RepID=A0A9P5GZ43_9HYPO|nr:hypothetical protein G7Z17_g12342 [Cylindrodendrum hubeiense]